MHAWYQRVVEIAKILGILAMLATYAIHLTT